MLEEFSISLFVIALLGAACMVAMVLFRQTLLYATRNAVAEMEGRVTRTRASYDEALKAHEQNQVRARDLEEERRMIQNQLAEAQRRLLSAQTDNFELIHEVGEPATGRRLYVGSLSLGPTLTVNQTATTHSHLRGCPHLVEVWAENQSEALRLARQAFPETAGFTLPMVQAQDAPVQQLVAS
ncbi:hypothetical protein [Nitrospirillum iridis]|uniref:Uncharacterized protein n=1 Tax=Nitrospirillum iridis TaxID=765888 RepID=A0A7X0EGE1_9PROT|nr:hypothetical protein [Nitrospirillum iridis]MBB6254026.1 hypothetical protein [Nitrospirillum iridis]